MPLCAANWSKRASLSRNCSRRRYSSVTSRKTSTAPMTTPAASWMGAQLSAIWRSVPSRAMSAVWLARPMMRFSRRARPTGISASCRVSAWMMRKTSAMGRPRASPVLHPVSVSATALRLTTLPSASQAMTPSPIERSVADRCSSLSPQLGLLGADARVGAAEQDIDHRQQERQQHPAGGPGQGQQPREGRLFGGDVAHDQQVADLFARSVPQGYGGNPPVLPIGVDLPVRFEVCVLARHLAGPGREGVGQAALGGVDHHAMGQAVPRRPPVRAGASLFPGLPVQTLLADDHGQLVAGAVVQRLQHILDLLAEFHIAGQRPPSKTGCTTRRVKVPACPISMPEAVWPVRSASRAVKRSKRSPRFSGLWTRSRQTRCGIAKVEMREMVLPAQRLEHGPPGGQQTGGVALAQGLLHRGVGGDGLRGRGQTEGLLVQVARRFAAETAAIWAAMSSESRWLCCCHKSAPAPAIRSITMTARGGKQTPQDRFGGGIGPVGSGEKCGHTDQKHEHQAHRQGRPGGHVPLPGAGVNGHAQHGGHGAGGGVGQRYQRRDPGAPAVGDRAYGSLDPGAENASKSFRCLVIDLPGRGVVLRTGRLAVHEKEQRAIVVTAQERDKPALLAGLLEQG